MSSAAHDTPPSSPSPDPKAPKPPKKRVDPRAAWAEARQLIRASRGRLALGLVLLLIGATTVFGELQDALDRIWRVPVRNHAASGWLLLVRTRVLSFGMVLAIGFLLMVSLLASTADVGPVSSSWMKASPVTP